jgi:hypothetical protein
LAAICAPKARATTVTATGGLDFGRNSGLNNIKSPTPILGADYYLDLSSHFQIGGFYDIGFPKDLQGHTGLLQAAGATARLFLLPSEKSGPYLNARVGLVQISDGGYGTINKLGFSAGVGYQVKVSEVVSLSPQAGVRFLPNAASGDMNDHAAPYLELGFSFHF